LIVPTRRGWKREDTEEDMDEVTLSCETSCCGGKMRKVVVRTNSKREFIALRRIMIAIKPFFVLTLQ